MLLLLNCFYGDIISFLELKMCLFILLPELLFESELHESLAFKITTTRNSRSTAREPHGPNSGVAQPVFHVVDVLM